MSTAIVLVSALTCLIHFIETSTYSLRIAGINTKKIATALSLITSILMVSRLSNLFQAPILGFMVDESILSTANNAIPMLVQQFRWVVFFAFIGSLIGGILTPVFVESHMFIIHKLSKGTFLLRAVLSLCVPQKNHPFILGLKHLKPSFELFKLKQLPKHFLILNVFVTAFYTIGVLCALIAGALIPEFRATAINLSGIVNGMGTILMATMVDPVGARITDQVAHLERPKQDIYNVVFYLVLGRLLGTLIVAQLLLLPLSHIIKWLSLIVVNSL